MEKLDSVLVILVQNLKVTVTLMTNVKKVSDVDQTIAQIYLDLMLTLIVVILQFLVMRIFAQLMNLVKLVKVTVMEMMNVEVMT